jgi:hypothetical protein
MHPTLLLLAAATLAFQDASPLAWGRRIVWSAPDGPAAREHAALIADPERGRLLLLGGSGYTPYLAPLGDAWSFDLVDESWSPLELAGDALTPGGSQRVAAAPDGAYLHGGYGADGRELGDLWHVSLAADAVHVARVPQDNPPPARQLHGFACDASGRRFVVFGGGTSEDLFDDTWIGTRTEAGVRWERLASDVQPSARFGFAHAFDPQAGRFLVCGGELLPPDGQNGMAVARDLWALDLASESPAWTRLAEYASEAFPGRRNPAFAFDARSGDLLVWGGTGDGSTALPDLYVVRTRLPGAPVERLPQPAAIPTRASGFGFVDPTSSRAWLGFGNTSTMRYQDMVEVVLRESPAPASGR